MSVLTLVLWIIWSLICALVGILTTIGVITIFGDDSKIEPFYAKLVLSGIFFEILAILTAVCLAHYKPGPG